MAEDGFSGRPLLLPPDGAGIARAVAALAAGDLVGLPTETVYGLAADATDGRAVARIYEAKGRPRFNPLILHVSDSAAARRIGLLDEAANALADAFWPGPLTLVVPLRPQAAVAPLALAGLDTVALRVPAHPVALGVLSAFGRPVAAPSANPSGGVSPTEARHVVDDLGARVAVVLDGGTCAVGLESTIVRCTGGLPTILRPGGLVRERLAAVVGRIGRARADDAIEAPGMLRSHYAPRAPVRIGATDCRPGEAIADFACALAHIADRARAYRDLSPSGDLGEAAARLFSVMRELDSLDPAAIAVAQLPVEGLGEAILDRLDRAAAPRPRG